MRRKKMLGVAITCLAISVTPIKVKANDQQNRMELPIIIQSQQPENIIELEEMAEDIFKSEEDKNFSYEEVVAQMSFSMDMGKPCGLSKKDFVELLSNFSEDKSGFFERNAEFIWEMEQEYGVSALLYCGICGCESGFATHKEAQKKNNYAGMLTTKGKLIRYKTEEAGIEDTFQNLSENYISKGKKTLNKIGRKFQGTVEGGKIWAKTVYSKMKTITSDYR